MHKFMDAISPWATLTSRSIRQCPHAPHAICAGLMYCLEYLEKNLDWLEEQLAAYAGYYFIFDCPGQAELYTHHSAFPAIVARLQKLDYRLAAVHLVDAHHCNDAPKFVAAALLSLTAMVRLELPHINALSKADLAQAYGALGASKAG
jgi:GTPase SAR1 family protein